MNELVDKENVSPVRENRTTPQKRPQTPRIDNVKRAAVSRNLDDSAIVESPKRMPPSTPSHKLHDRVQLPASVLIGSLHISDAPIYFREEHILGDGNCGFTALPGNRNAVTDALLGLKAQSEVRTFLREEIQEAFITGSLLPTDEWLQLDQQRIKAQGSADNLLGVYKDIISAEDPSCYALKLDMNSFNEWLSNANHNDQFSELTKHIIAIRNAEQALINYYHRETVFEYYINHYRENLWLGYKSALLFANAQGFSVYIWQKKAHTNQLELIASHVTLGQPQEFHLLSTGGFTHYNLLTQINLEAEAVLVDSPQLYNPKPSMSVLERSVPEPAEERQETGNSVHEILQNKGFEFLLSNGQMGKDPEIGKVYALAPSHTQRFVVLHIDENTSSKTKGLILNSAKGDYLCRRNGESTTYFFVLKEVTDKSVTQKLEDNYKKWMSIHEKFITNTKGHAAEFVLVFSFKNHINEVTLLQDIGRLLGNRPLPKFAFLYPTNKGLVLSDVYTTDTANNEHSPTKIKYFFTERKPITSFNLRVEVTGCTQTFQKILVDQAAFIDTNPLFYLCGKKDKEVDVEAKYYLPDELAKLKDFLAKQVSLMNELTTHISKIKPSAGEKNEAPLKILKELSQRVHNKQIELTFVQDKIKKLETMFLGDSAMRVQAATRLQAHRDDILHLFKLKVNALINPSVSEDILNAWFDEHQFTVLSCLKQRLSATLMPKSALPKLPAETANLLVVYYILEHPAFNLVANLSNEHFTIPATMKNIFRNDHRTCAEQLKLLSQGFSDKSQQRVETFTNLLNPVGARSMIVI